MSTRVAAIAHTDFLIWEKDINSEIEKIEQAGGEVEDIHFDKSQSETGSFYAMIVFNPSRPMVDPLIAGAELEPEQSG